MNKDKYLLSSVANTLEILDLLSKYEELGVAEISKKLNMGRASVFRMLYTLEKKEFVHKMSNAKYRLGIKFAHYGSIVLERQGDFFVAKPFLQKLRDKHNQTTHLAILDDDYNIIFMDKELSKSAIQMTSKIGAKLPSYVTATGKVLLASRLDKDLEKIKSLNLVKMTDATITDNDKLIEELKKIKVQGYGADLEESEIGLVCYAAPIKDITGKVIAAISISGASTAMVRNKDELVESVKQTAEEISKAMGYNG
ncbi:IclR family transcriptional regulator [Clostridium sp. WLY-B-L2]|uniref:IclR family transcriptional regulator n=1 Tax=Clostridium aromativorans TaxID=2836848 RepID=A0ABS8NA57_9CLOT|nr:IclR family transcriptional regulator [Clostridium aromativorans]MCC9296665.1 IclR family transcriptional regulator [Clostridium aromativorans]